MFGFVPLIRQVVPRVTTRLLSKASSVKCGNYNRRCISSKFIEDLLGKVKAMPSDPVRLEEEDVSTSTEAPVDKTTLSSLVTPVVVESNVKYDEDNVGEELVGPLDPGKVQEKISEFINNDSVKTLSMENGLDEKMTMQALRSFYHFSITTVLPTELHIVMHDVINGAGHIIDIFPHYLQHAKRVFPHLDAMDELERISDLTQTANWYAEARSIKRKIVMHVGPTNSGKTYHALKPFMKAETGLYCSPLRLLANEVYQKCHKQNVNCSLVTGEDQRIHDDAQHVACTVEMCSTDIEYDVAVIDEIQMLSDPVRGYAWTRALLGVYAKEVHLCGEESAVNIVKEIAEITQDEVVVNRYERLSNLEYENKALGSLDNIKDGDCIVCFSKTVIHKLSHLLSTKGIECAIIYGSLPPATKLYQAAKFNDPSHPCKVMLATDAIGMGLNLSIRRIVFHAIKKLELKSNGVKQMVTISTSQAKQIAGRAGRFGTSQKTGYVTTFYQADLPALNKILSNNTEEIKKVGLTPTSDMIEMFAYHLPNESLSNLMRIFHHLSRVDEKKYFLTNVDNFCQIADLLEHIRLPVRVKYTYCMAPVRHDVVFARSSITQFASRQADGHTIDIDWLMKHVDWPLRSGKSLMELTKFEEVFHVLDLYLWLGIRFGDVYTNMDDVKAMQEILSQKINKCVEHFSQLKIKPYSPKLKTKTTLKTSVEKPLSSKLKSKTMLKTSVDSLLGDVLPSDLVSRLKDVGVSENVIKKVKADVIKNEIIKILDVPSHEKSKPGPGKVTKRKKT